MKTFKKKRQIAFVSLSWWLVLHIPLLLLGARLYHYNPFWSIALLIGLAILDVVLFRYINHHFFDVNWLLHYLDENISSMEDRIEKIKILQTRIEDDEEKLECLQKFWNLESYDEVKEHLDENLELLTSKLSKFKESRGDALLFEESTLIEYAQKNLWH